MSVTYGDLRSQHMLKVLRVDRQGYWGKLCELSSATSSSSLRTVLASSRILCALKQPNGSALHQELRHATGRIDSQASHNL
jgi:hypothetical protein